MHLCRKFEGAEIDSLRHSVLPHPQTWMSACLASTTAPIAAPTLREGSSATAVRGTRWTRAGHSAGVSSCFCSSVQRAYVGL